MDTPFRIATTDDPPEPGKSFKIGDALAIVTNVQWGWIPPSWPEYGEVVLCHSREVAEACLGGPQGGSIGYKVTYEVKW